MASTIKTRGVDEKYISRNAKYLKIKYYNIRINVKLENSQIALNNLKSTSKYKTNLADSTIIREIDKEL